MVFVAILPVCIIDWLILTDVDIFIGLALLLLNLVSLRVKVLEAGKQRYEKSLVDRIDLIFLLIDVWPLGLLVLELRRQHCR